MTIQEAQDLMSQGQKLTHSLFTRNEYITYDEKGNLIDELGHVLDTDYFWSTRNNPSFLDGWRVFKES